MKSVLLALISVASLSAVAESHSFNWYCSYTGTNAANKSVYVRGPNKPYRSEAKSAAQQMCQDRGLSQCSLYGCYRARD